MKTRSILRNWSLYIPLIIFSIAHLPLSIHAESQPASHLIENYARTPLAFEHNQGQTDEQVKFLSRGQGYVLFLTQNEAVLSLRHSETNQTDVVRLQLIDANPDPIVEGLETQPSHSNYLIGNDASKWRTNVGHTGKVKYNQVYDGIDLIYYGNQRRLEYDYIVAPGINPSAIKMRFVGAQNAYLDETGNLILQTNNGEVIQQAPISYQEINGQRRSVSSRYVILKDIKSVEVGFKVGHYDTSQTLIIDPILTYAKSLEGSATEKVFALAIDQTGQTYVTGYTSSSNFPIQNAFQDVYSGGTADVFVSKLDATGTTLLYSTFLGGNDSEAGRGIDIDADGNAYIIGETSSSNFPVKNAFQETISGSVNAFVTKLNASGTSIDYSTYFGGNNLEAGRSIAVDSSGNAYITGYSASSNLPLLNAFQNSYGGGNLDAFIAKLDSSGNTLIYSTYFGGDNTESSEDISIDASGKVYITGTTQSSNLPIQNAFQSNLNGQGDAFIAQLSTSGNVLEFATYLGGQGWERGDDIAVDQLGNIYIAGYTPSSDLPILNAFQTTLSGPSDAFVAKIANSGTPSYITYLGGSGIDSGHGIAVDQAGNTYITGFTTSSDFPLYNELHSSITSNANSFITKLDALGTTLYSTYIGENSDGGVAVDIDIYGNAYVAMNTQSESVITTKVSPMHLSTTALSFGNVNVDSVYQQIITITNNSLVTLTVSEIAISGTDAGLFSVSPSSFSLATNQTQEIVVTFSPTAPGTQSATLSLADNISGHPIMISLNGQGTAPALSVSDTSIFCGNSAINTWVQKKFTITNTGNDTLTVALISLSGPDADMFYVSPIAFPTILSQQSVEVDIVFTPTSAGLKSASISIAHNASDSPSTVSLSGQGITPIISLSTTSILFENTSMGGTYSQTISVSNTGNDTLKVTHTIIAALDISVTPSSFFVLPGQSQIVTITAEPAGTSQPKGTISFFHNATDSPTQISTTVSGIAPEISLSANSLSFGEVEIDTQKTLTLQVSNIGSSKLSINGITSSNAAFTISPITLDVYKDAPQTIAITYSPTSVGNDSATVTFTNNSLNNKSMTVLLTGTGIASTKPPNIDISSQNIAMGNTSVGNSASQILTLSNTGDATLTISDISLSGTDASIFSISPTSLIVLPGQHQDVTIIFAPASTGSKSASLSISHNASGSPTNISLTGQGTAPVISPSATSFDFGNISVNSSTNQTLTLSNTGDDTLKVTTATLSGTDASIFSVSPTSFTVLPSQNQEVTLTATPTTYGDLSATLSIVHNASGSPTIVSLSATGQASDISISTNALNFGDVEVNAEKTLTLVVTNSGNVDLTVSNITSSNSTFTISPTTVTIGANNNQGVGVTFKPTSTGNQSATVTITSNDPDSSSITMTLTGTGTQNTPQPPPPTPVINFSSPTVSFGNIPSGTQHSQDFTISNTGQATLSISDISLTGDAYSISSTLADIAPGQNGTITITFSPTEAGETTGTLTVTHNASGSPNIISLTGTGVVEPAINIAQTSLDFGQVLANTTSSIALTITNPGNADLQITNFTFTNPRFVTSDGSLTIAGGDSQQVAINFLPVTGGLNTGTLTITHNASSDPIQISLSGEGTLPLGLQITPSSIDFARVDINGQSNQTLTLENPGTDTLNIVTLQTYRLDFQVVQGDSIPITLAPSESRVLDLLFLPRRSGITTGDLTLSTADSTFTIPLQGEGVVAQPVLTPQLEITPQEITFTTLSSTVSDTAIITVSNTQGTGTLFVTNIQSTDSLITVNADSFIIKPGEQRQLQVIAQAAERDFPTGQINLESNDPNTPTASLSWRAGALLEDFVLLDLDNQTGDQNMQRLTGVLSGDSITVQFFSKNFPTITGYGMFVDYNTTHMTFLDNTFNTSFITGATEQIRDNNGRVNFGVTSFSGVEASGDAFLGELTFKLSESFADSTALTFNTITLSLANGSLQELPQRTSVWLVEGNSPDFSGDGQIDFRDFLLFGQAFGGTDPNFDLDGDGTVGFPDFILFAAAFGG